MLLCYGWGGRRETLQLLLSYWGGNLLLGAVLSILEQWLAPLGAVNRGGIYYFPVQPLVLVLVTIGCYLVLWLVGKFRKKSAQRLRFRLQAGDRQVEFTALVDTGNRLRDPITGRSVLVVQKQVLRDCLPPTVLDALSQGRPEQVDSAQWQRRCGVLPIRTAGRHRLIGYLPPGGALAASKGETPAGGGFGGGDAPAIRRKGIPGIGGSRTLTLAGDRGIFTSFDESLIRKGMQWNSQ